MNRKAYLWTLGLVYLAWWILMAIKPLDFMDWAMENVLVVVRLALLLFTAKAFQYNPDLLFRRMAFPRLAPDIPDDLIGGFFVALGFASHLHSLVVTMSPKPSVTQSHHFGPLVLTSDRDERGWKRFWFR